MSVPSTSKRMRSFSRGSAWVMAAEARSAGSDVTLTEGNTSLASSPPLRCRRVRALRADCEGDGGLGEAEGGVAARTATARRPLGHLRAHQGEPNRHMESQTAV